jgi:hypothetical protein
MEKATAAKSPLRIDSKSNQGCKGACRIIMYLNFKEIIYNLFMFYIIEFYF